MRVGYFLSEAVTNLRRNLLMTVAAISTVAISLLLLGGVQILGHTVAKMTDEWEESVQVKAYLLKNASVNEKEALRDEISEMPEVVGIDYVSSDEALAEFREDYDEFADALPPDALPASYRIELTDAQFAEEVAARIRGAAGVESVQFGGQFVKTLLQINSLLRTITLVMSVTLMVAAAALIANTIRLGIYARRDEIGIMKLVGATNMFIRVPFVMEGLFAALVGAAVSILIVLAVNVLLFSKVGEAVPFMESVLSFSSGDLIGISARIAIVGTVVGLVGSILALRRFLQV
jgi:cell division transport system permease protein